MYGKLKWTEKEVYLVYLLQGRPVALANANKD